MKEKLNELLDSIYELEGLVHLALTRDDNPERLPELIARKGEELARHAESVAKATTPSSKQEQPLAPSLKQEQPLYVVDQEEAITTTETVSSPIEEDMQSVVESVFNALPEEVNESLPEEGNDALPEEGNGMSPEEDVTVGLTEDIDGESEEVEEADEEVGPVSREPRGKLVFSINDRYRFKRELFNNSDADFNNTLALVASMEGYDEAEDYFIGELQWDPKSGDVIDFLEILKRYFKE